MPKTLVTEKEWLQLGLKSFGQHGVSGINIEKMARTLGCAKSSFYWYFGGRKQYLESLLRFWRESETHAFYVEAEKKTTPAAKLTCLLRGVMEHRGSGDLLFHLRKVSEKNALFRKTLQKTEQLRIGYLTHLLEQLGEEKAPAREKAGFIYHYYLGWYERNKSGKVDAREVRSQLALVSKIIGRQI
ncbi:MAG: TetR/AcrR family transcriptional regulator [Deltaproteobacteria bacterium]|nr:TetR/AcrR family transcriptional regulator [Deltaproteobacteria bacterium]